MEPSEDLSDPPVEKEKKKICCSNVKDRVFGIGCLLTLISILECIAIVVHSASIGNVTSAEYCFGYAQYVYTSTSFSLKTRGIIVILLTLAFYGGLMAIGNITLTKEVYRHTMDFFHRWLLTVSQMNAFGTNLALLAAMLNFLSGTRSPLRPSAGVVLLCMGLLQGVLSVAFFLEGRKLEDTPPDPEPTMEDIYTIDSTDDLDQIEMDEIDGRDRFE